MGLYFHAPHMPPCRVKEQLHVEMTGRFWRGNDLQFSTRIYRVAEWLLVRKYYPVVWILVVSAC